MDTSLILPDMQCTFPTDSSENPQCFKSNYKHLPLQVINTFGVCFIAVCDLQRYGAFQMIYVKCCSFHGHGTVESNVSSLWGNK